jgi:23S rRNA (cytosine1962-C5)-methyltransferase
MTKPRTPRAAAAPKAQKTAQPTERSRPNPPSTPRKEGRESRIDSRLEARPRDSRQGARGFAKAPQPASKPSQAGRAVAKAPLSATPTPKFQALGAKISRRAADRLRAGHLWVYSSDIESISLPQPDGEPPAILPVADSRGLLLGTALYSPSSQIALRLISREALDEPAWLQLLETRLRTSLRRRKLLLNQRTDACRLCFSEADELPGLVVDKYGDLVILQLLAKGLDSAAVRESCVRVLREELTPAAIFERPDPRVRELEGLSAPSTEPLWTANSSIATSSEFHLNGLTFHYDANSGQKTGAFLDQRANYAATAEWARRLGLSSREGGGRALDVCCYQGGFALHLAQVCASVTGIDASRASLEVAEQNFAANREQLTGQIEWVEADAFALLRDWSEAGERFDAIVLDPPAFAKSQRAVEGALRGYKELNLRALKMLNPGGLLVTCSCSHHVGWPELEATVSSAAADAHRRVRLVERRAAAPDHPVVLNLPETEYLKCLLLEVE